MPRDLTAPSRCAPTSSSSAFSSCCGAARSGIKPTRSGCSSTRSPPMPSPPPAGSPPPTSSGWRTPRGRWTGCTTAAVSPHAGRAARPLAGGCALLLRRLLRLLPGDGDGGIPPAGLHRRTALSLWQGARRDESSAAAGSALHGSARLPPGRPAAGLSAAGGPDFGRVAPLLRAGRAQRALDGIEDPRAQFSRGLLRFCILYSGVAAAGAAGRCSLPTTAAPTRSAANTRCSRCRWRNFSFAVRGRRTNPPEREILRFCRGLTRGRAQGGDSPPSFCFPLFVLAERGFFIAPPPFLLGVNPLFALLSKTAPGSHGIRGCLHPLSAPFI